jgi:hypothetical protein
MRETTTLRLADGHGALREGIMLGLAVGTSTWLWIALVDALAGEPFRTFTLLGGIAAFTAIHYLLNVVYAGAIVSAMRGAGREPSLMMAVAFGFLMVEFAFAMITALLAQIGLGELAWLRIFAGSVVGMLTAIAILARKHPLLARLREADVDVAGELPTAAEPTVDRYDHSR